MNDDHAFWLMTRSYVRAGQPNEVWLCNFQDQARKAVKLNSFITWLRAVVLFNAKVIMSTLRSGPS